MDVLAILHVTVPVDRSEHLFLDDFREPDDGVQRCPEIVAHAGQKIRLALIGPHGVLGCGPKMLALGHITLGHRDRDRLPAVVPKHCRRLPDLEFPTVLGATPGVAGDSRFAFSELLDHL